MPQTAPVVSSESDVIPPQPPPFTPTTPRRRPPVPHLAISNETQGACSQTMEGTSENTGKLMQPVNSGDSRRHSGDLRQASDGLEFEELLDELQCIVITLGEAHYRVVNGVKASGQIVHSANAAMLDRHEGADLLEASLGLCRMRMNNTLEGIAEVPGETEIHTPASRPGGFSGIDTMGKASTANTSSSFQASSAMADGGSVMGKRVDAQRSDNTYRPSAILSSFRRGLSDMVAKAVFTHYEQQTEFSARRTRHSQGHGSGFQDVVMARGWARNTKEVLETKGKWAFHVQGQYFDSWCAFIIIMNVVFLGVASDQSSTWSNPDKPPKLVVVFDRLFSFWFVIELFLRIYSVGPCCWLLGRHWRWNLFDGIVVSLDVVDTVSQLFFSSVSNAMQNLTAVRMLRVFRIGRAIRVIRLIRFFKDLRLMVISILRSGASLVWCMVLLTIIIYIFAICLMQNVVYYLYENRAGPITNDMDALKNKFGGLMTSCYTLFQCVSGGISWHEVSDPLYRAHWLNGTIFVFYVFFTLFALVNIITGIFVENAMSCAQNDSEEVIAEQMYNENSTVKQLQRLFSEMDTHQTGLITKEDFGTALQDLRIRTKLAILGVDVHEAEGVFRLLDICETGAVSIEEFVYGCMRMKGGAKNVDVATLLYENKRMADKWSEFFKFVKKEFKHHELMEINLQNGISKVLKDLPHQNLARKPLGSPSNHRVLSNQISEEQTFFLPP